MTDEVKIFSNISDDVIEFDDKDDFQRYYAKNKDYVDKFTTRGLNVKYKIPNYKIGRSHGVITLYPLKDSQQQSSSTIKQYRIVIFSHEIPENSVCTSAITLPYKTGFAQYLILNRFGHKTDFGAAGTAIGNWYYLKTEKPYN